MPTKAIFPSLDGWEPTRDSLHAYCRVVGVVPRTHAKSHPKWWHISLKVKPDGLTTRRMSLPDGSTFWLKIDLVKHKVILVTSRGVAREFSILAGIPDKELGDQILKALADLGLSAEYTRSKYESGQPRQYDPVFVEKYRSVLVNVNRIFKKQRASLQGERGPVQLWLHGFDLAFEWFGNHVVAYEENGEVKNYPAQLSLGFSPGESSHPKPYFYSNPWPFEKEALLDKPLPVGTRWFMERWQGSILPYSELVGDTQAEDRLLDYARAVFEISATTLMKAPG